ncbi:Splicing factor U2AF 23 kDa subunit-like protein [Hapsidospora chrysogenum ATCC 11550]|uniref:Splicing factor U2AF 23 kDa subunit-like protein n=1 Tax=Hapsidospora chrysogenum (strain ATCC 11550 / CBS 779.69 / DSM 880 / IAM 14645 / JCM 23072 / IMI 49137) TaxID=857340 RepID=A0A086TF35_HAPC1|nr:Splicing factor U2AF 23 kDa subunit-like protein [Hapsidospora chrysogenum ATCC 11550]
MASFLASIFGTELDKVNCSFYFVSLLHSPAAWARDSLGRALALVPGATTTHHQNSWMLTSTLLTPSQKIGACRHGDRCSRKHVKPSYSQTILMPNLYQNPAYDNKNRMNPSQLQNHFDAFYEDIWCELCKYGELEELVVCDNNNDHLIGNVYARFKYEESAQKACDELNSRWYAARPIYCELSPVTDFREACCRLNSGEGCVRGGFCNFIHRKNPSEELDRELTLSTKKWLKMRGRDERSVSRSPTPEPTRRRY